MLLDALGDLLSAACCAACAGRVAARRVFCGGCSATVERAPLDDPSFLAFAVYGGALAQSVHHFKYSGHAHLARPLGHLLRTLCRDASAAAEVVIPVPLHPTRLVARGYNQAALLAAHVAAELGAPLRTGVLARVVATSVQAELDRAARLANVDAVFAARPGSSVRGRHVVLVDDVVTTGATMDACSTALLAAGARAVTRVVLARTLGEPMNSVAAALTPTPKVALR